MIYTLYEPNCGGMRTWSISTRISSTELFDAASSSCMLNDLDSAKARHDSHSLHGSWSGVGLLQLMVFAKIRAQVVLPTPRGPQKRYACPSWLFFMEFFRVCVIASCPTTISKVSGRYFLADTMYSSISKILGCEITKMFLDAE